MKAKRNIQPELPPEAEVFVQEDGTIEGSPLLTALNTEFPGATDSQALQIALALQQLMRGQESILAKQDKMSEEIAKLKHQAVARDKAMQKYKEDQEKFLRDAEARGERLRTQDPQELAKLSERYRVNLSAYTAQAKIKRAQHNRDEKARLETEPRETIISLGVVENRVENGTITPMILPELLIYKNMKFLLPPGKAVTVPATIAKLWRDKQASKAVKDEIDSIFDVQNSNFYGNDHMVETVAAKMAAINNRHGLKGQSVESPIDLTIPA